MGGWAERVDASGAQSHAPRAPPQLCRCPPPRPPLRTCSEGDYDSTVASWRAKLQRVRAGEQKWGLFRARKPSSGRDYHPAE